MKIYKSKTIEITDQLGVYVPVAEESYEFDGLLMQAIGNTISGNTSQAGSTVYWMKDDFTVTGSTTADGSGNYITGSLSAGNYNVCTSLVGFTFSPMQVVTVSGSNVTGVNFTSTVLPTLIFTQLAADSLTTTQNPLNPANWTLATDGFTNLRVSGSKCRATGTPGTDTGAELYTGVSFPNNQYAEIKIVALTSDGDSSEVFLQILTDPTGDTTQVGVSISNNGDGTALFATYNNIDFTFEIASLPFAIGDVFRLAAYNNQVVVYQNGTQIAGIDDSGRPVSGAPLIGLLPETVSTDAEVTTFAAGSVTTSTPPPPSVYSVPDCRDYGNFPNTAVDINGTETYTVQTESRKAGAPVDSRTTKPTASGTYPQNSRTPGTFGPGE